MASCCDAQRRPAAGRSRWNRQSTRDRITLCTRDGAEMNRDHLVGRLVLALLIGIALGAGAVLVAGV